MYYVYVPCNLSVRNLNCTAHSAESANSYIVQNDNIVTGHNGSIGGRVHVDKRVGSHISPVSPPCQRSVDGLGEDNLSGDLDRLR